MVDVILSTKPLQKLTGTGGQVDRRTDGQTGEQDHVLSQADALTKKLLDSPFNQSNLTEH